MGISLLTEQEGKAASGKGLLLSALIGPSFNLALLFRLDRGTPYRGTGWPGLQEEGKKGRRLLKPSSVIGSSKSNLPPPPLAKGKSNKRPQGVERIYGRGASLRQRGPEIGFPPLSQIVTPRESFTLPLSTSPTYQKQRV